MDPTSSTLHRCRCCLQTFRTHLELLVHSFTHSRWDQVRVREEEEEEDEPDGPGDGHVKEEEEGLEDGGGLQLDFKVEEEGPALWPYHVEGDQDGATGKEGLETPADSPLQRGNLAAEHNVVDLLPGEQHVIPVIKKDSSYYFVQGIQLRRFSIVVDPIVFCPKCSKTFVTKQELKEHEREEHTGGNELEMDRISTTRKVKRKEQLACPDPGKTFRKRKHLRDHRKEPIKCEHCGRVFSNRGSLGNHVRSQICQKSLTCGQCNKLFRSHLYLSRHMVVHSDDRRSFNCDRCNKSFKSRYHLKYHQRDHMGEGLIDDLKKILGDGIGDAIGEDGNSLQRSSSTDAPLCCPFCAKNLATRSSLISHVKRYHARDKSFACNLCSEKFKSHHHLVVHNKHVHNIGAVYPCKYCDKVCINKCRLAAHERRHTGEKPFNCSMCSRSFSFKKSMQRHELLVHSDVTPFICDKCGKGFKLEYTLKDHMEVHESGTHHKGKEQHACKHCCKVLGSRYTLQDHMRSFHGADMSKHSCPDCSLKCVSETALRRHRQKVHGYKTSRYEEHKCSICHLVLSTKSNFDLHMRRHTGERPFKCTRCGKGFIHQGALTKHVHGHTSQHSCPHCSYKNAQRANLIRHMQRLHYKKVYKCLICHRVLLSKSKFDVHMRSHTVERPLRCTECSKAFVSPQRLHKHMLTHAKGSFSKCSTCSKSFSSANLKNHECEQSDEKQFECNWCGKVLKTRRSLRSHLRTCQVEHSEKNLVT